MPLRLAFVLVLAASLSGCVAASATRTATKVATATTKTAARTTMAAGKLATAPVRRGAPAAHRQRPVRQHGTPSPQRIGHGSTRPGAAGILTAKCEQQ